MAATPSSFRQHFTEFADPEIYPNSAVQYWLGLSVLLLSAPRFGRLLDMGCELFVAHNLAIEARAQAEANNGAPPGGVVGPVNNKSVDKVSVAYDTQAGIDEKAGHWNLTVYGTRLKKLINMFGAGTLQVGADAGCVGQSAYAWPGPIYNGPGYY